MHSSEMDDEAGIEIEFVDLGENRNIILAYLKLMLQQNAHVSSQ